MQLYTKCWKVKMCFPVKYSSITDECFSHFLNKTDRDSYAKYSPNKEHDVQQVIFF